MPLAEQEGMQRMANKYKSKQFPHVRSAGPPVKRLGMNLSSAAMCAAKLSSAHIYTEHWSKLAQEQAKVEVVAPPTPFKVTQFPTGSRDT